MRTPLLAIILVALSTMRVARLPSGDASDAETRSNHQYREDQKPRDNPPSDEHATVDDQRQSSWLHAVLRVHPACLGRCERDASHPTQCQPDNRHRQAPALCARGAVQQDGTCSSHESHQEGSADAGPDASQRASDPTTVAVVNTPPSR